MVEDKGGVWGRVRDGRGVKVSIVIGVKVRTEPWVGTVERYTAKDKSRRRTEAAPRP